MSGTVPVLHITEDMAAASGGVPAVVRQLAARWARMGQGVTVLHAKGDASDLADGIQVVREQAQGIGRLWSYSGGLLASTKKLMQAAARNGGVAHIHGLWSAPPTLAAQAAAAHQVPFIFTAHGMLVPWLWTQQGAAVRLKKTLFWHLLAAPGLRRSTVVHAITPMERDELRLLLPDNRIEVIPNAIEIGAADESIRARDRVVLFLGRIEPKKGVDILIRAFAAAGLAGDWRLEIVGPPWSDRYMNDLRLLVRERGIESRVTFRGPVFGSAKEQILATAWVMVAPSHSEVVGLVNLEAGSRYLPSITTHQTGLWDWAEGGGLLVQPDVSQVAHALRSAAAWSDDERTQRGIASRQLVERRYSWPAVMPIWQDLYNNIGFKDGIRGQASSTI